MVKALVFVIGLGSLLLCASAALSQPTVCTRYENGRMYILPGCRGPIDVDGTTRGPRRHPFTGELWGGSTGGPNMPFTGQPWGGSGSSSSAQTMSWPLSYSLVPLGIDPGGPAVVEGAVGVKLTASFREQTAKGARISRIRITTKDLIEQLEEDLGVSGKRESLVRRRSIGDLAGADAQIYLVVDGVDYLVEGFIESLSPSLSEGLQGSASAHTLRRGEGAVTSFELKEVSAVRIGDLTVDGFTMNLFSLDSGRFVWKALSRSDGFLCRKLISKLTGGMQMSELPLESPMLVTGILQIGPEKVVSP